MKFLVILFAFVALASSKILVESNKDKDVRNKIMNFNYEVEQFLDKVRDEREELLDGQHESIAKDASKFLDCVSSDSSLIDSTRNVFTKAYKMIIKKELQTPIHEKFCQEGGFAKTVFKKLKNCTKSKKRSPFLKDLSEIINGTEQEICASFNLEHKLAVAEKFREEIDSDHFKTAFKRYDELLKDCNKLKAEDHCLPQKLADAFDAEAIKSQVFSYDSRKFYKTLAQIYFTTAIKAPYKRSSECYKKLEN